MWLSVASVGSRCLGCLVRRFGDLDQARVTRSEYSHFLKGQVHLEVLPKKNGILIEKRQV